MREQSVLPRVSIGLPVYNGDRFLAETLDSILAQTFADFDVLIVDNASTDRTAEIGQAYAARDARIWYQRNTVNVGAMRNFNLAFRRTSGAYFKWWAADDLCRPPFLEHCVHALDAHPRATLAYTRALRIDECGRQIGDYDDLLSSPNWTAPAPDRFRALLAEFLATNGLTAPIYVAGLMPRQALERTMLLGSYIGSDLTLTSELALAGELVEVPEPLLLVRAHAGSSSFGEATGTPAAMHEFINPSATSATPPNTSAAATSASGLASASDLASMSGLTRASRLARASGLARASAQNRRPRSSVRERLAVLHTRGRRFPAYLEAIARSPLPPATKLSLAAETTATLAAYVWRHVSPLRRDARRTRS
jgi:hypothetical protein